MAKEKIFYKKVIRVGNSLGVLVPKEKLKDFPKNSYVKVIKTEPSEDMED